MEDDSPTRLSWRDPLPTSAQMKNSATSPNEDDQPGPLPQLRQQTNGPFRRSSSVRTTSSSRQSQPRIHPGASTDSLLSPRATGNDHERDEPTLWHSVPLLFAVVPALGGVIFKKGSIFITDLALLILAALYLNWCLVTPWIWYRSAQAIELAEPPKEDLPHEEAVEDTMDGSVDDKARREGSEDSTKSQPEQKHTQATKEAMHELRMHELTALALCFLGPLLGSYILHLLRSQLSTIGDELVSNLHLTLFVLGAEIRPLRYAIKMAEARTLYLQRVVREDPYVSSKDQDQDNLLGELRGRLDELESGFATKLSEEPSANKGKQNDNSESIKRLQSSTQSQIDALNRAVRRYEKRETTYTMQTEARLMELDKRLKEAVSLAAAAANYSQKPGVTVLALNSLAAMFAVPLKAAYIAFVFPYQLVSGTIISVALRLHLVEARKRESRPTAKARGSHSGKFRSSRAAT